jgi:Arc/MetJ-type ribon-helix-helix transcriptional regulator
MVQKKITIKREQEAFLAACKNFGFADQSSLIRAALDDFIKETKRKQRRAQITRKAGELAALYGQYSNLIAFTAIDGDDFYEASGHLGNSPEPHNWSRDSENPSGSDHK